MAALNIVAAIRERSIPTATALVDQNGSTTYSELFARCDAFAAQLPDQEKRLRLGVDHPSGVDYVALALAVLAAGHCFVPIPPELGEAERQSLIARTALNGIVTLKDDEVKLQSPSPDGVGFSEEAFSALNPAFIRFSSGTTGTSKGVVLSHESLLERITAANKGLQIGAGDRVLWVLPMAHHFAVSIILYLYHGATTVLKEQFFGEDLLAAGREHQVTVMYGSPVHYRQLAAAARVPKPWPQLRLAVSTAAALDAETAQKFEARFQVPLTQGLGIIEVGLPMLNVQQASTTPDRIGPPQVDYEAKLDQPDEHGAGQLCLRGPGMFDAYLDPWKLRCEVLDAGGWFHTGDLARRDENGSYQLVGRSTTVINTGGMKVFPEEVERVLDHHPGVRRSLVQAKPHPLYGEVIQAMYEPAAQPPPSAADLRRFCKQQLAAYKVPVLFVPVDQLPTTASGKLKRTTP